MPPDTVALDFGKVPVHGFLTQGAIYTSDNNFFGESDDGISLDYTEIGLNSRVQLFPDLSVAGQILFRRAGSQSEKELTIDHAFLDYQFLDDFPQRAYLSAGRVKLPYGLFNETRDVAFTRPSILMPQPVYFDRTRRLAVSGDGLMARYEYDLPTSTAYLNVAGFMPNADEELRRAVGVPISDGPNAEPSLVGRLMYETADGRFRLGFTHASLNLSFDTGPQDFLAGGDLKFNFNVVSVQYNAERWSFTSEYTYRKVSFSKFGPLLPNFEFRGEGLYVQGDYRFSHNWLGFVRVEALYPDRGDHSTGGRSAVGKPSRFAYQEAYIMGVRWDLSPNWMLAAEFHNVRGVAALPAADNRDIEQTDERWNILALQLSYRF